MPTAVNYALFALSQCVGVARRRHRCFCSDCLESQAIAQIAIALSKSIWATPEITIAVRSRMTEQWLTAR
ncbi:hypothetical protein [Nostoc sp.]|uniref:hypothetical protein n=1 Tax=Nostoc sp. TaxID=1180 RepID=UPI002FF762E5